VDRLSELKGLPRVNQGAHLGVLLGLEGYGILFGLVGVTCLALLVVVLFAPKLREIAIEFITDLFGYPRG
jgi:hypothetical protein